MPPADNNSDKVVEASDSAPLPPDCKTCKREKLKDAVKDAGCQIDSQVKTCKRVSVTSVKFVTNEFLRKPIYAVEKASLDAEGERLCREECRLNKQSERLAAEADRLAEKIKDACPNDLHAKFKLLKEQASYADEANDNAVRRAKLELKQSEYCQKKGMLEAKHKELFPAK
jgi:hypothetical protein